MWKIYKEGQGKWARGILMFLIGISAIYLVGAIHSYLQESEEPWKLLGWTFDYRWLIEAPILLAAAVFGVWLFNHQPTVDFLIDTENELKNKVTWPTKQEEINASIVVCVTVILMMCVIVSYDAALGFLRDIIYPFDARS